MLTNALWVLLFVALATAVAGAAYLIADDRGEERGKREAALSEEEKLYFDASVAKLVDLGYTWTGGEWVEPTPGPTAAASEPTRIPDRTSCEAIEGTPYRSISERVFFLANCVDNPILLTPTPLCGNPENPWCYDLFPGELISSPPIEFCGYFECVDNFWTGTGYVVRCQDGAFSKTGGTDDACSGNGGVSQPLYSH